MYAYMHMYMYFFLYSHIHVCMCGLFLEGYARSPQWSLLLERGPGGWLAGD